jgi:ferrous iron transport protein A
MTLSSAKAGIRLVLVAVQAGRNLASRLAELGIFPGVEIMIIKNDGGGPVICEIRGSRVMLGRGEANKVLVRKS